MIIENPEDFFKRPEEITSMNIVDIVNRFTNMIESYIVEMQPAFITMDGKHLVVEESDTIKTIEGQTIKFEDFMNHDGIININDGKDMMVNRRKSRVKYRPRTKKTIAANILLGFIRDDISKRSNWEAVYDVYDAISEYVDPKFNVKEVCDYITERIDPLLISVSNRYYGMDWNVFDVDYDGHCLTITRYGDWRAYSWNKDQFDKQMADHDPEQ